MKRKISTRARISGALAIAAVIVAAAVISGCSLIDTPAIQAALSKFAVHLSVDRSHAYTDLDPSAERYDQYKSAGAWDSEFPAPTGGESDYDIKVETVTDPDNVSATITGANIAGSRDATFSMKQVSGKWLIHKIYLDGDSDPIFKKLK